MINFGLYFTILKLLKLFNYLNGVYLLKKICTKNNGQLLTLQIGQHHLEFREIKSEEKNHIIQNSENIYPKTFAQNFKLKRMKGLREIQVLALLLVNLCLTEGKVQNYYLSDCDWLELLYFYHHFYNSS